MLQDNDVMIAKTLKGKRANTCRRRVGEYDKVREAILRATKGAKRYRDLETLKQAVARKRVLALSFSASCLP